MSLEWFIARRYLASRRGARFLSLITLIAIVRWIGQARTELADLPLEHHS